MEPRIGGRPAPPATAQPSESPPGTSSEKPSGASNAGASASTATQGALKAAPGAETHGAAKNSQAPFETPPSQGSQSLVAAARTSPAAQLVKLVHAAKAGGEESPKAGGEESPKAGAAANTSQQRAAASPAELFYNHGGTTADSARYRDVALLKGTQGDLSVEVLGASDQAGPRAETTLTLVRGTARDPAGETTVEAMTLNASSGFVQSKLQPNAVVGTDGLLVTALAAETTRELKGGHSVTVGASIGLGNAVSFDVKDTDQDGHPEECAKVSTGPFTLGVCVESADVVERAASAAQSIKNWWDKL